MPNANIWLMGLFFSEPKVALGKDPLYTKVSFKFCILKVVWKASYVLDKDLFRNRRNTQYCPCSCTNQVYSARFWGLSPELKSVLCHKMPVFEQLKSPLLVNSKKKFGPWRSWSVPSISSEVLGLLTLGKESLSQNISMKFVMSLRVWQRPNATTMRTEALVNHDGQNLFT